MKRSLNAAPLCAALLLLPAAALAAGPVEYPSGHGALQRWDAEGIALTPAWVLAWLGLLSVTFLSSLAFVRRHILARWAIGGIVVSFFATPLICRMLGLPFLAGAIALGHLVFWTPALIALLKERAFFDRQQHGAYRIWAGAMTFVILFSFVFDLRDGAIYLQHFSRAG